MGPTAAQSPRSLRSAGLAWAFCALICAATLLNFALHWREVLAGASIVQTISRLLWALLPIVFALLSALITSRQSRNRIGWLLALPPLAFLLAQFIDAYLARFTPPPPPTIPVLLMTWFEGWSWLLLIFPLVLTLLLFPTGSPPSRRWRWVLVWAAAMAVLFLFVSGSGQTLHEQNDKWVLPNPIGLIPDSFILNYFIVAWVTSLAALTVVCAASLFVRYRRALTVERAQIRWLLYASGVFVVFYVPQLLVQGDSPALPSDVSDLLLVVSATLFPLAIAAAILRYRLWDIDVIINRTLVYVPLTAIVAGIFAAAISLAQKAFVQVTGKDSLGATVVATLVVVAVFNPIKDRVQRTVDRAFKDPSGPNKRLSVFQEQLRSRGWEAAVGPVTRRFLEEAVAAFGAEGGIAYLEDHGGLRPIHTTGEWKGEEQLSVAVESAGARVACIALGKRRRGDYTERERLALAQAAQAVGQAIAEDSILH